MDGKLNYPDKVFLMVQKSNCPFCSLMKPIFEEIVREYTGLIGLSFGFYNVDDDDWKLADEMELDGVPAFAVIDKESGKVYEINNDGLVPKETLVSMIFANLSLS